MSNMTPEQEEHLEHIIDEFAEQYDPKYRKGQKEHGPGSLFDIPALKLAESSLEESLDGVGYNITLLDKIEDIITILEECRCGCDHCKQALALLK